MSMADESQSSASFRSRDVPVARQRPEMMCGSLGKRRIEKVEESLTNKHFLSDEAMATRFTALSLGNDHRYSSNGLRPSEALSSWQKQMVKYNHLCHQESRLGAAEKNSGSDTEKPSVIEEGTFDMRECSVLEMMPQLRDELRDTAFKILPPAWLQSMMLPCRELVLWQARGRGVREAVNSLRDRKEQTDTAISPKEVKPKPAEEEMEF
eukprot:gi/632989797/ref/XP_007883840.1/ PREDICTED: uncharacterized protein LOC103172966 [Callorhinchus milii]